MPVLFTVKIQPKFLGSKTSDEEMRIGEASFIILQLWSPQIRNSMGRLVISPPFRLVLLCESAPQ